VISPARVAAYDALRAVASAKSDLPAALAAVRPALADERDRALATDLVTGALRWQNELDFLIGHFAKRPIAKLDFDVLQILRLGAYQLLHLDRVPASAAVNDAVAMTRRARKSSASGLVNAVLRAISRTSREALPLPTFDAPLDYLEIALSHPRWLASRWIDRLGFADAEAWERFNNAAAPLTLRVNHLKTSVEQLTIALAEHAVEVTPARYAPDGLIVTAGNPLRTPLANTGHFFIQDEASQLVSLLAAPKPGDRILDACASPGGKTTAMAAAAGDRAHIVAADVRGARMQLLRETVAASGAHSVRLLQANLEEGLPFGEAFDVVFVDAPCSGLGTLRRDPDIRWRRREEDLTRFRASQVTMLRNAAAAVKPGGRLIYSTCSSEPEENDEVIEEFLAGVASTGEVAQDFSPVDRAKALYHQFTQLDLRGTMPALEPVLDNQGLLRTSPSKHGLEAFFGAVLQRRAQ
jgi:16S rRNA (cytosine967-C5)-methyltransferase